MVEVFSPLSQEFILHDLQLSKLIIIGDGDDNWLNYILHFVAGKKRGSRPGGASLAACVAWRSKRRKEGRKALRFKFLFEGRTENVVCARRFGLLS